TPTAVLMRVGQSEQSMTTPAEVQRARCQIESEDGVSMPQVVKTKTMGNHASGLTGLKSWMRGLTAVLNPGEMPQSTPRGTARRVATRKPMATVRREMEIWS